MTPLQKFVKKFLTTIEALPETGEIEIRVTIASLHKSGVKLAISLWIAKDLIAEFEGPLLQQGDNWSIPASIPYELRFPPGINI